MVFPERTNHYGTLFAGAALSLMVKSAYMLASRYSRHTVVVANSEKADFQVPIKQGQLIEIISKITKTGTTSMTVGVELYSEDFLTGERRLGTKGKFVLVALDKTGKPTKVPPLFDRVRSKSA
ncbi:acyl-CoA thioesterase [Leptospira ilyithenensis]|uniref:Acyl-CoA thioesterase n=2 Tax=Leptospira ilyithenensis TaxID=2484901 RepID=A0A4V3JXL8_9LEPT|nr:acyl-CoA thioesterase [Leptospira ilyithenensis]